MIVVSLLLILVSGGLLTAGILQANDPLVMASIGVSVLAAAALFLGIRQQSGTADRAEDAGAVAAPPRRDERVPAGAARQGYAGAPGTRVAPPGSLGTAPAPAVSPQAVTPPAVTPTAAVTGTAAVPAGVTGSAAVPAAPIRPAASQPGAPGPDASTAGDDAPAGRLDASEVAETQVIDVDKIPPQDTLAADTGAEEQMDDRTGQPSGEVAVADDDEAIEDEDPPDEPAAELLMTSEVTRLSSMDSEVLVVDGRPRYHLRGCPHLEDKDSQPLPVSEAVELGFTACSLCSAATALLADQH